MTESTTRELLTQLVSAFGDVDAITALLAPDAQWWITPSVGVLGSPTIGRESIRESMQVIFGQLYQEVRTVVHHVLVEQTMGAARFTMFATANFANGQPYENEYSIWIRVQDSMIDRVWEYLDTAHVVSQFGLPQK